MLSFQKLIVYQRSIDFYAFVVQLPKPPRGNADLADQLRRSARSVPANIAEGAGRATPSDTRHYYAIARGSAMESAAHLDCYKKLGAIAEDRYAVGIDLLKEVVSMLTRLCQL